MVLALLSLFLGLASAQDAGGANLGCFHGVNDADSGAVLPLCDAQAALNTESNLDGTAIIKRKGFQLFGSLTYATAPVNGSHSYIDSSGNKLDIVCHDRICAKSTNGNAFSNFLSTAGNSTLAAVPRRWSFVDVGGVLYGGNDRYDPILKYDGTTLSYPLGMPKGSILELTQDRLAVADIQALPNRIHYSSAGNYEAFTLGVNPEDSFFDEIGAPGDKIRGLKYLNGVMHIFKTGSLTGCELADQYTTRCAMISPTLGTTDPASIINAGSSLYFRAQDKTYWELGNQGLRQISRKIPNLVKSQSGGLTGGEQTNTQTTQADWQAGTQDPLLTWNTETISGSIFPSSVTLVDTSSADFAAGTLTNISTNVPGYFTLSQASTASFVNAGAESGDLTNIESRVQWANNPIQGGTDAFGSRYWDSATSESCDSNKFLNFYILDATGTVLKHRPTVMSAGITESFTIDTSTLPVQMIKLRVRWGTNTSHDIISKPFIRSAGLAVKVANLSGSVCAPVWDVDEGTYTLSGTFLSQPLDTAFSTPTWASLSVGMSSTTEGAATLKTQVAHSGGAYDSLVSLNNDARITSAQKRLIKYEASLTVHTATNTPALISTATIIAATTGQFISQCIQPGASISAWGTLNCGETKSGNGSLVYYATSAASCATLPTSAPSSWVNTVTNNATLGIGTNTAIKIGFRSLLGAATDQAQVDSCVLSWTEGTAAQPAWAAYDSIKNAVYWTATVNNAATTNRLLKYDRNLESWHPWDIPAQAPRVINNVLYFGGASSGTWNIHGSVDSDLGNSINAYWKSRDFGSDAPFRSKSFKNLSILSRNSVTGSMTGTYTFSNGETRSYTISLSTGSGIQYAFNNYLIGLTSPQSFMNVQVGNNSSTPFEVLGIGLGWILQPWKVSGP